MKDRQPEQPNPSTRIPVVSALLHCVSMPIVVLLRSGFGYVYLRPKSIFAAFSWAAALFVIYAWNEPHVWRHYRQLCVFSILAVVAYWWHLGIAVRQQYAETAEHDYFSGHSHGVRLLRLFGVKVDEELEFTFHAWIEPVIAIVAAGWLRLVSNERTLASFLLLAGVLLCVKELLNQWFRVRQRKRQQDIFEDAESSVEPSAAGATATAPAPPRPVRKQGVRIQRERPKDD